VSVRDVGRRVVELCNQGKTFDVMRTLYAPNIVSVEGDGAETAGQEPVIKKSEIWQANNDIHSGRMLGPYFNGPDQFAVHYVLDVTPKATGKRTSLEEVIVYTVKGDKITREQCFFDGAR
jgi:hypothetical protein